jgi:hypothetical protein
MSATKTKEQGDGACEFSYNGQQCELGADHAGRHSCQDGKTIYRWWSATKETPMPRSPEKEKAEQVEDRWPVVTLHRLPGCKPVKYSPTARIPGDAEEQTYYPAAHLAVLSKEEAIDCAQNLAVAAPSYHHEVRPKIEALARRLSAYAEEGEPNA